MVFTRHVVTTNIRVAVSKGKSKSGIQCQVPHGRICHDRHARLALPQSSVPLRGPEEGSIEESKQSQVRHLCHWACSCEEPFHRQPGDPSAHIPQWADLSRAKMRFDWANVEGGEDGVGCKAKSALEALEACQAWRK